MSANDADRLTARFRLVTNELSAPAHSTRAVAEPQAKCAPPPGWIFVVHRDDRDLIVSITATPLPAVPA
mgnify:CR=1 FL=1